MPAIDSSQLLFPSFISILSSRRFVFLSSNQLSLMVPELERPHITEIHVRMDCNGCVQKIKRALHGIKGIYDLYIDFPNQKLTIVGWADPEKIVKAIKKTRKTATICSHIEPPDPSAQPPEQPPDSDGPPSDAANPPPQENPSTEPPNDNPQPENQPSVQENPNAQPESENPEGQPPQDGQQPPQPTEPPQQPAGPKDVGEVHIMYQHPPPPDYGYRYGYGYGRNFGSGRWYGDNYHRGHEFYRDLPPTTSHPPPPMPMPTTLHSSMPLHPPAPMPTPMSLQSSMPSHPPAPQPQPQPVYVTHSYNTYKPSPYVTEYHDYVHPPPPQPQYRYYGPARHEQFSEEYYNYPHQYQGGSSSNGTGNVSSFFSDENPNACRIM